MNWCSSCGTPIRSNDGAHNCGHVTISKDRLRDLERIERGANTSGARDESNEGKS